METTLHGSSSDSGYYTAACLADNNCYYYFSDTLVSKIEWRYDLFASEPYSFFYEMLGEGKIHDNLFYFKRELMMRLDKKKGR